MYGLKSVADDTFLASTVATIQQNTPNETANSLTKMSNKECLPMSNEINR